MKTRQILTNFTGGIFGKKLRGRVDISKYFNACRTLSNMIVFPQGGASSRFGTVFVAETKASATIAHLIPFQFNITQAYILEFGEQYIRFFRDSGTIVSGVDPYEISTTYTTATLFALKYAQDADKMRIVHEDVYPKTLTRTGHIAWTLASTTFTSAPSAWTAASGYPSDIALYEQRSVYAASTSKPQSLWFGVTGSLDDMTSGTDADDGMELILDDYNVIKWIKAGRYLNVGTGEGEWVVSSGATDEAMTPTKRKARRISRYGSSAVSAISANNAILFIQRTGRKLRELVYNFIEDSYGDPPDLTIFADEVLSTGVKAYAFQKEPNQILWCVLNDGNIAAFTYNKEQEITAWHTHETDGTFEDVAVMPVSDHDQVWFIVRRTVNGIQKRYIEYLAPDFGDDQSECWFVDSGLRYSGTATTQVGGLDHLAGKSVSILADGAVRPDATVTASGYASVGSPAASVVIAGLPFSAVLEPMDLETKEDDGSSQGRRAKIHQVMIRFYKTLGAKVGTGASSLDIIPFRTPSDTMGSPPPLFTGDKIVPFPGGWSRHKYIRIEQDQPLPLTVTAIVPLTTTND